MKKQLAVLMAAATAVTTVAPVVANAADPVKTNAEDIVSKVKTALEDKYTNDQENGIALPGTTHYKDDTAYMNSKNIVLVLTKSADATTTNYGMDALSAGALQTYVTTHVGAVNSFVTGYDTAYVVKDYTKLANYLETKSNGDVAVVIIKKGDVAGKSYTSVVKNGNKKYALSDAVAESDAAGSVVKFADEAMVTGVAADLYKAVKSVDLVKADGEVENKSISTDAEFKAALKTEAVKIVINLKSGSKVELAPGKDAYDLSKPTSDEEGKNSIVLNGTTDEQGILDSIKGFKLLGDAPADVDVLYAPSSVSKYVLQDVYSVENIDLGTVYTADNGYTEDGAKKVTNLGDLYNATASYNYNGVTYDKDGTPNAEITANGDKGYVLTVTVPVVNHNDAHVKRTLQFKIAGASQADLVQVKTDIVNGTDVVAGRFKRIVGADRYQTAIEASKAQFKKETKFAESVVIVGGNALLDGLSAAPLASAKDATVLLAHPKSGLSADTLAEIKRATDEKLKNKTVYIVGGTDSVPASVEKDLENLGAVVIRIAGADRYATSKAIAERLVYDGQATDTTFLVGGNGAADAMSIAPVASRKALQSSGPAKVSPILVVKKDDIPQDTRNFLLKDKVASNAYIVGGVNSVGTGVYSLLKGASITTERISGADRYDTNIQVLNKFYKAGTDYISNAIAAGKVTGLYVASGADKALVDAQVIGAYATSTALPASGGAADVSSPILLVGSKLTDDQIKLMNSTGIFGKSSLTGGKVYQVGGAVSSDAMKVIVDKLDLH